MVILPICLAAPAHAQYTQQGKLVVNGSVGPQVGVGTSVAISADGNTALVGGPNDNAGAGAVWVFTRNGGTFQQSAKLLGNQVAALIAGQGSSVALSADGNTAVVGGMDDDNQLGAMWAFTRTNGVWTQQGPKQVATVLSGQSRQGISIALSADGNTALLGGDQYNSTGAAWVFTRTAGVWGLDTPTAPLPKLIGNSTADAHQGASVALSADGNTAILGGPGDNNNAGAAFVFTRNGGVWTQQAKLPGTANAGLGSSVALSADGNTAVVGASLDNNKTGSVWVFTRTNGQWTQQTTLVGSNPAASRYLGQSAAITADGNTIVVGGPGGLPAQLVRNPSVGATWVFTRTNGVWTQQQVPELVGSGTVGNDALQGSAVGLTPDGTTALVGGPTDNGRLGAVWVFTRPVPPSPPVITTQPASGTVPSGQPTTLSVVVSGAPPLSYQWYQGTTGNTSAPVGTNSPSFTTPVLTAAASYWVRVSNPYGSVDSSTAILTLAAGGPVITQVLTVANQSSTIAPNTFVEIHGTNLAPAGHTRAWQGSDFTNSQLPVQLDTVTATVNGRSGYVEYISPTQVNILTPPDALQGTVQVLMSSGGVNSAPFPVLAQPIAPAFFVFPGSPYVAAEHTNGSYLGPASLFPGVTPAKPGETVVLYGSGFGPTVPPVVSGSLAQSGILPTPPVIIIGGIAATVQFAGLVVPGEFQFNVVVPASVPDGDNTITAVYGGLSTQSGLLLTVQH
jgi:uncharacterized protein (TIGR03437 family)